jgi:hypothetical protein
MMVAPRFKSPRHFRHGRSATAAQCLCLAVLLVGCSVPPEQPIVNDFFVASRLRDKTALARFATIAFEPQEHGTVLSVHVVSVSPERLAGPVRVKEVTVSATMRGEAGPAVPRTLIVMLQKPVTGAAASALYDGWIVTGVTGVPSNPATPRS